MNLQGSSGDAGIEDKPMDAGEGAGRRGEVDGERVARTTDTTTRKTARVGSRGLNQGTQAEALYQPGGQGGGGRGEGHTCVPKWPIHADVWPKPKRHCKAIILNLKYIIFLRPVKLYTSIYSSHC